MGLFTRLLHAKSDFQGVSCISSSSQFRPVAFQTLSGNTEKVQLWILSPGTLPLPFLKLGGF